MNKLAQTWAARLALLAAFLMAVPAVAAEKKSARPASGEEFYIISSIDPPHHRLVLMLPTQVTKLMLVNDKTSYLDESGKSLHVSQFRAGDTVYASSTKSSEAELVAVRIRKGSMTVAELHRRYLPGQQGWAGNP